MSTWQDGPKAFQQMSANAFDPPSFLSHGLESNIAQSHQENAEYKKTLCWDRNSFISV